jgi:hypothetical protein
MFCVTSTHSAGCTFVDWSVHWLSGAEVFYNTELRLIELTLNPLGSVNAHGHKRNHPKGSKQTKYYIDCFNKITNDHLLSFYPTALKIDMCAEDLSIHVDQLTATAMDSILAYQEKDYAKIWDLCSRNNVNIVYISPADNPVYFSINRSLDRQLLKEIPYTSKEEAQLDYLNVFFKESFAEWQAKGLTNKWDLREFLALNLRPYLQKTNPYIDFALPHLYIDSQELWYNGYNALCKIMDYLDIKIDSSRIQHWLLIYKQWQDRQLEILKFTWNLDHICKSIVDNYYYPLESLDLQQEAIIQHVLIFKYGMNIRGWGLEKFPNNTQDLHKLLEVNTIHTVKDIYNKGI